MRIKTYLSAAAIAMLAIPATALGATGMPKIELPAPGSKVLLEHLSDNGKWGVAEQGPTADGDLRPTGGVLYNMTDLSSIDISHSSGLSGVSDVTDDGTIVVGECNGRPGYWSKATKTWKTVEMPKSYDLGRFNVVTPDGKYAAGYFQSSDDTFAAYAMMYDLTTGKQIELPNLPVLDMTHRDQHQNAIYGISPDGRYLLGELSQSYLLDNGKASLCCYVYDRETKSADFLGFTPSETVDWTPDVNGLFFCDAPRMSNNGEWVTGFAYMVYEIPGSEWTNEAYHTFRYNVKTKKFEVFDNALDADIAGFSIGNDGTIYAATPAQNPYATAMVYSGKYFISLDQIFKQVYNYDYTGITGNRNTGKCLSVSNDGLTLLMLPDTEGTYVLRLPEPLSESAKKVKLLGSYNPSPVAGAEISKLRNISLVFDRNIVVADKNATVQFVASDGSQTLKPIGSNGIVADGRKATLTFRPSDLKAGVEYTLTIPAGTFAVDGDASETNEVINIPYIGRANTPVEAVEITPIPETYHAVIDAATNPILIQFDTAIQLTQAPTAYIYQNDVETPYGQLNIATENHIAYLFPTNPLKLWEGSDYRVVLSAGSVTDISGEGANKEISFKYYGSNTRDIDYDSNLIFGDDSSTYEHFMFYDGDNRNPDAAVSDWGFTPDTTPWLIVKDDDGTDFAFASHSMYIPAGKADDWMVTPQLLIPDSKCHLSFEAQSFLLGFEDYIDVYVYACDEVYNTLTKGIVDDIRTKGKHVVHKLLHPGAAENTLAGDWEKITVDLAEYADKFIYIAFANLNEDQSAVFVDNIKVEHDMTYYTTFEHATRVVDQNDIIIKGFLRFGGEFDNFKKISMTLLDANGKEVSKIEESGLELKKDVEYDFEFPKALPLVKGEVNAFSVNVVLDDDVKNTIKGNVSNLAFQPARKIVLEEYTGSECGNCPLGIRGIQNIEFLYPDALLPITIRTYQSDPLGLTMGAYSQFLGLDNLGAPSGILDRKTAGYPMINVNGDYRFTGSGIPNELTGRDEECWLDIFRQLYESPAEVSVEMINTFDSNTGKIKVEAQVTSALNKTRTSYNVFAVLRESNLMTYQKNYLYNESDPDLGEWGKGGKYGTATVIPVEANDVARLTWGTTYMGTNGLIPSTLKANETYRANITMDLPEIVDNPENCDVVVMLIDAVTGYVLNSNACKLNAMTEGAGVENIAAEKRAELNMAVINGQLYVNGNGKYNVAAYDMTGARILSVAGEGLTTTPLNGFSGVLIVKASDAEGNVKSAKFIVR